MDADATHPVTAGDSQTAPRCWMPPLRIGSQLGRVTAAAAIHSLTVEQRPLVMRVPCGATVDHEVPTRTPRGVRRVSDEQFSALLEVMPEIAAAVNGFQSEAVQRDAFRVLVDLAGFDVSRIDWNESAMSAALLEGLLGQAGFGELMDKLAAIEATSSSLAPDEVERQGALSPEELREMARQAGRGEPVSFA